MAPLLQRHLFFPFTVIFVLSLFISGYTASSSTTTHDHQDPHNNNQDHDYYTSSLDQEHGYDFQAYPSPYISTTTSSVEADNDYYSQNSLNHEMVGRILASTKTVSVDDFGAKGDGLGDDTQAFEKAWSAACSYSGAAVLLVPRKNYLVKPIRFSGPCKSTLTMLISGTIEASNVRDDYIKDRQHWLVYDRVQNLMVEGGGTIDGNGKIWWQNSCKINKALPCKDAPTALAFYQCKNITVKDLKIQNAQQIHVSFDTCVNVQASNLAVTAPGNSPNTDGIHVTSTQNIQISGCVIGTGDDCISIVSGSQKVQATDITCGPGHGISIGSLGSGNSAAYVSDVVVNGAKLSGTTNGVRIKTWKGGSGSASNIKFQNVEMQSVSNPIIIDQNYCDTAKPCPVHEGSAVQVKNVLYQNIKGTSATGVAVNFGCSKAFPCQGIVLQNVNIAGEGGATAKALCNNVNVTELGVVSPRCP